MDNKTSVNRIHFIEKGAEVAARIIADINAGKEDASVIPTGAVIPFLPMFIQKLDRDTGKATGEQFIEISDGEGQHIFLTEGEEHVYRYLYDKNLAGHETSV